ncbi:transcription initiation factor TFIID subunit 4-like [Macaca nemestrina]|uniref:transcription initiation factor TFIID subunit 4-like n=1 Tax=Macaca nemestrina TaxID=9545 RepID=UPI0039B95218
MLLAALGPRAGQRHQRGGRRGRRGAGAGRPAEGRADWPGSSGLRRPMQMRPRSQLAAAPARRGPRRLGTGARAARHRLTSRAPGAALLDRPRCGSGGARVRRGPRWPPLRRAQAANFGGVRAAPSPPARRARPFIECLRRRPRPPPPPPGGPSRSERPRAGLRPGAFVSPGLLGRRASCSGRAGSAGRLHCSAAVLGAAQRRARSGSGAPALRTFSPGPASPPRASPGGRPGSEARGRSGAECARRGGRTSARPTFRFGSGAGRAAPPLLSLPCVPPPFHSLLSPPPIPRAPPTPERPPRPLPPPGPPRPRASPPEPLRRRRLLKCRKGRGPQDPGVPTLVPLPHGPPGASGVGSERDRKFQLHQSPARGPPRSRISGMTRAPVALSDVKRQHGWPPGASPSLSLGEAGGERPARGAPRAASSWQGWWRGSAWGRNPRLLHRTRPGAARGARRAAFHSRIFPLASQPEFSRPPLIVIYRTKEFGEVAEPQRKGRGLRLLSRGETTQNDRWTARALVEGVDLGRIF